MINLPSSENKQRSETIFLGISPQISQELKHFVGEKHYLFDYYRRHKNLEEPSWIKSLWKTTIDLYWKKKNSRWFTISILFLMSLGLSISFFIDSISNEKLIVNTIVLMCCTLTVIQFIIIDSPQELLKKQHNPIRHIDLAAEFDPSNHLDIIKSIGENNSVKDINIERQRFQIVIISQTRFKNIGDSAIPLIAFFYGIFIVWIFGIHEILGESLNIVTTILGFGLIPLIARVLSFITELSSENLLIYQHCLFILEEALIIAQGKEDESKLLPRKSSYNSSSKEKKKGFLVEELVSACHTSTNDNQEN